MTIIDNDFIKNQTLISLRGEPKTHEIIFKEYYYFICDFINDYNFLKPNYAELEKYINDGSFSRKGVEIKCPIQDKDTRVYTFKRMQAEQLRYDQINGTSSLIADRERQGLMIAPRVLILLEQLGLKQKNYALK